jgi:hypothetical protein
LWSGFCVWCGLCVCVCGVRVLVVFVDLCVRVVCVWGVVCVGVYMVWCGVVCV